MVNFSLNKAIKGRKFLAITVIAFWLFAFPIGVFSSESQKVFVDGDVSSSGDGSSSHPYKTIGEALEEVQENGEIFIKEGTYKENLELGNGIEIYGDAGSKEDVVIQAEDDDESVVIMGDETKINKVTIKGGKHGIKVKDTSKASIEKCLIKDNKQDGINIESDGVKKSRLVYIADNEIKDNNDAGIYSGKRRLTIEDNQIENNDGDGIDIEKGSRVWAKGNRVNENHKSGIKIGIDKSEIWIKSNSIRNNKREGVEVSFYQEAGKIEISKSKILNNGNYGVARVQRNLSTSSGLWANYLIFGAGNSITGNDSGQISGIFLVK